MKIMTNSEAKKFIEAVYKDIWCAKNLTKFDKYYHKDLESIAYLPNEELEFNYSACKKFAEDMAKTRYKVENDFEEIIVHENKILVKYKQRSINRATNQVINVRTAFQYELDGGKIKKCWAISNRVWTL